MLLSNSGCICPDVSPLSWSWRLDCSLLCLVSHCCLLPAKSSSSGKDLFLIINTERQIEWVFGDTCNLEIYNFQYFSIKIYVVHLWYSLISSPHKNICGWYSLESPGRANLISAHNILSFYGELQKIIKYPCYLFLC